jgi:hypothetical protein
MDNIHIFGELDPENHKIIKKYEHKNSLQTTNTILSEIHITNKYERTGIYKHSWNVKNHA